ncbi:universal stress protein [Nocardia uniformis]|uniref:Universal stress protein n=1 Tax=Nocardia uniformis TaxID=53432 RepID=A0A849BYG7_9NOCA|nr:universal stress protein [Nocardia uniformis]NNH69310.1 universal stress protein [Nocardia uniformis]
MSTRGLRNTDCANEIGASDSGGIDPGPAIVVGVDGSSAAMHAAEWAATEAAARQVPLRLIHFVAPVDKPAFRPGGTRFRQARDLLETARKMVLGKVPEPDRLEVQTAVLRGHADTALLEMSESAALIVVGTSGAGFLTRVVLGSTALALVRNAHCPVAIVRRPGIATGPVLAPVIGWPAAAPILMAGMRAAALRHTELLVVRIWQGRPWAAPPGHYVAPSGVTDAQIAQCRRTHPDVEVRSVTVAGNPAEAIERFSAAAQLVVIGTADHRYGGGATAALAHELVRHCDCPVLVLPAETAVSTGHGGRSHAVSASARP